MEKSCAFVAVVNCVHRDYDKFCRLVAFIFIGCSCKLLNPPFSPIFFEIGKNLKPLLFKKKKLTHYLHQFTISAGLLGLIPFPSIRSPLIPFE